MTKKLLVLSALLVLFVFGGAGSAFAAVSASAATSVTCIVPTAIALTVNGPVAFGQVPIDSQTTTNLAITVKCNEPSWSLTVYKDHDLQNGAYLMPSANLVYTSTITTGTGQAANTQFNTSGSPTNVVTGATVNTKEAGAAVTVTYKLTATFDDTSGNYAATHTYTAAGP